MEVTIGVQNTAREINIDTDLSIDDIEKTAIAALKGDGIVRLSDTRGRTVLVPAAAIAYLEVGPEEARKVGFGSL